MSKDAIKAMGHTSKDAIESATTSKDSFKRVVRLDGWMLLKRSIFELSKQIGLKQSDEQGWAWTS